MEFDPSVYDHIPKNQNGDVIPDTLIIDKERTHAKQYRNGKWSRLSINQQNTIRFWQGDKRMRISLSQIEKILTPPPPPPKIPDDLIECEKYRGYTLNPKLYRKFKNTTPLIVHYDYFQDQGSGLQPLPCITKNKPLVEFTKSDHPPLLSPSMIKNDQEQIYLDFVNEFEEVCDCYRLQVTNKKSIEVLITDLDIEYNLLPTLPDGMIQIKGSLRDDDGNFIKMDKHTVWHDAEYKHWFQRMDNGWYHWETVGVHGALKILDDNDKWRWTYETVEQIQYQRSPKPSPYDDGPQTFRRMKVLDPNYVFSKEEGYLEISRISDEVGIPPQMLYWEMPNGTEPRGRFVNQVGVQVLKDGTRKWKYQDLGVKNGKVDVIIDKGYKTHRLLDFGSFFEEVLPKMYPKEVEKLQAMKKYPIRTEPMELWALEEEELGLPYFGWKPELFEYQNRPRMRAMRRLNEEEDFVMLGCEEKSKKLLDATLRMMNDKATKGKE
jgi:hypothetical protein